MGDPRRSKNKFRGPRHPWERERIEKERVLKKEYGLKNKREIWKANSFLNNVKYQIKKLTALSTPQAIKERELLMKKLVSYGLVAADASPDHVLSLELENILDRRLQTLVYKLRFARTINQARQFIVHGHIMVGDKPMTVPGYLVKAAEESLIAFNPKSPLASLDHPERFIEEQEKKPSHEVKSKKAAEEETAPVIKTEETTASENVVGDENGEGVITETPEEKEVEEAVEELEAEKEVEDREEAIKEKVEEELEGKERGEKIPSNDPNTNTSMKGGADEE